MIPPHLAAQTAATTADAPVARVIVKIKPGSTLLAGTLSAADAGAPRAKALGQRVGLVLSSGIVLSERAQVVHAAGVTSEELARRLAGQGDVEYAVPDLRRQRLAAPNDPLYPNGLAGNGPAVGQWYLRAPTAAAPAAIDAEAAWSVTTGNPGVVVAVLDTGVRFEHPDLRTVAEGGNLLPGYDMISDPVIGNDGDGRDADASDPGDWLTLSEVTNQNGRFYQCSTQAEDSSWHGTQVAGLIAALTDNGIGMASIGRNVRVLPVRVLGKCGGYDSDIIAGMRWAAGLSVPGVPANANRAQVINLSLGGDSGCTAAYQDVVSAVMAAGTAIVASAGNDTGHTVVAPANCPGVIAVGGLRHVGTKVGYSNVGPEVAISAPAGNCVNTGVSDPCLYPILTTSDAGATTPTTSIYTDSYKPSLGTSFSAPLVTGTVALMLSVQPTLTPAQVLAALKSTALAFPKSADATVPMCTAPQYDASGKPIDQSECQCSTTTCGAGMLDAGAAVLAASAGSPGTATGTISAAPDPCVLTAAGACLEPTGTVNTVAPTYTWNAVPGATQYTMWVGEIVGSGGVGALYATYTPAQVRCAGGTGTCSVTPDTALKPGSNYVWLLRVTTGTGDGPWILGPGFSVAAGAQGGVTQLSPTGTVNTVAPNYTWSAVPGATQYTMWVGEIVGSGGVGALYATYTSSQAGCESGTGTCSVTPDTALKPGSNYVWLLRVATGAGDGPWSPGLGFSVAASAQGGVTQLSPTGTVTAVAPTYTWSAVPGATQYTMWVGEIVGSGGVGVLYANYTPAQSGCAGGTGTCSVAPNIALKPGSNYVWLLRTTTGARDGPWGPGLTFIEAQAGAS